jgi:hypothetical protein
MAKKKTKPGKKRNPQDTTLRNVRAGTKRIATLTARVDDLEKRLRVLEGDLR